MRALIIVDLQNDFLPGGALAVPHGDEIIAPINTLQKESSMVIASKDWHPPDHISFDQWPPHCIQGTWGAEFPKELELEKIEKIFFKGDDPLHDSYSAFSQMSPYLKERKADELIIVGLALDYCVLTTALDAAEEGWKVTVDLLACKAIGDEKEAVDKLKAAGVEILGSASSLSNKGKAHGAKPL